MVELKAPAWEVSGKLFKKKKKYVIYARHRLSREPLLQTSFQVHSSEAHVESVKTATRWPDLSLFKKPWFTCTSSLSSHTLFPHTPLYIANQTRASTSSHWKPLKHFLFVCFWRSCQGQWREPSRSPNISVIVQMVGLRRQRVTALVTFQISSAKSRSAEPAAH